MELNKEISELVGQLKMDVKGHFSEDSQVFRVFDRTFADALQNTIQRKNDGNTYVITGDIPAMWLRDSSAQIRPYLVLAKESAEISCIIRGVITQQLSFIIHDPYANAFNPEASHAGHQDDITDMTPLVWERKYELDSLCYPIELCYLFWKASGHTDHFNHRFREAIAVILDLWECEQDHSRSPYSFQRANCPPSDTLVNDGKGSPVAITGMTWSGFRPSDDACQYGYLIPANMFAVVVLGYLTEIAAKVLDDPKLHSRTIKLQKEIQDGINSHGTHNHPIYGTIYAYETDGFGNKNLMDDANVPSLLSLPYIGYCSSDDPIYLNTRKFILSKDNPYYYQGTYAAGIGSPHTPEFHVWPIALAMEGLTTMEQGEAYRILENLVNTEAGTLRMHESFHVEDPSNYTRDWFSWANALFCQLVLRVIGKSFPGDPGFSPKQTKEE